MLKLYISDKYSIAMLYHFILNVVLHPYLPYNDQKWKIRWVQKKEKMQYGNSFFESFKLLMESDVAW